MKQSSSRGVILYYVLVFGTIALLFIGGLIAWAGSNLRFGLNSYQRELALGIAEAGIEYYRWHLAHAPSDYQDGTGGAGPYVHQYRNAEGEVIGRFELSITAPPPGSTVVTIRSDGHLDGMLSFKRSVEAVMAKPSLARYAVAANADIRFGAGTEIFGPVHSNGGVRFDGLIHNLITSAQASYNDPDHTGDNEFGVHTHVAPTDPLPPAAVPSRPDVFEIGRQFPVPAIDFTGFTADFAGIKTAAQASGVYLPNSGALGYRILLKTNDTFDVYRVTATTAPPSNCYDSQGQSGWGTWSVQSETFLQTYAIPTSGAVFVEDHVWVSGQINTARITIASARFPEDPATNTSITVNNDLLYTNYDGRDVISLMSQNNVNAGLVSENDLRVDAALIAKNGRVGRYYYRSACAPNANRNVITLFGMLATNLRYGFAYTGDTWNCGGGVTVGSGYCTRNITYDSNLLYSPPPYFPVTSGQYETVSWSEIQ